MKIKQPIKPQGSPAKNIVDWIWGFRNKKSKLMVEQEKMREQYQKYLRDNEFTEEDRELREQKMEEIENQEFKYGEK